MTSERYENESFKVYKERITTQKKIIERYLKGRFIHRGGTVVNEDKRMLKLLRKDKNRLLKKYHNKELSEGTRKYYEEVMKAIKEIERRLNGKV